MPPQIELRFEWPVGSATFKLTKQEALKAAVVLRGLGLGLNLTLKDSTVMVTRRTDRFSAAETLLAQKVRSRL
jgi:hypothetical protein